MDEQEIARSTQLLLTQYKASYIDNVLLYRGTQDIYRNHRMYTLWNHILKVLHTYRSRLPI